VAPPFRRHGWEAARYYRLMAWILPVVLAVIGLSLIAWWAVDRYRFDRQLRREIDEVELGSRPD
jgi:hypothetical protein